MPKKRETSADRPTTYLHDDPKLAETKVVCPVCKKGMVPVEVAAKIRQLLKNASDGPDTSSIIPKKR